MSRWLLVVLCLSASLLFVPAGSAQLEPFYQFSMNGYVVPYPELIEPIRDVVLVHFEIEVSCGPLTLAPIQPLTVHLSVRPDVHWAVTTVSPQNEYVQIPPEACLQGHRETIDGVVEIEFTEEAPAYARATLRLVAEMPHAPSLSAEWTQTAGQFFQTSARFDQTIVHAAANQQVQLPITMENHGNGDLQVTFAAADGTSQELAYALPAPVIVPPFGGAVTVPIDVNTPYGFDGTRRDALVVHVMPRAAADTGLYDALQEVRAVIVTAGDGGSGGLPAEELPAFGLMPLAALGLAALAVRPRR